MRKCKTRFALRAKRVRSVKRILRFWILLAMEGFPEPEAFGGEIVCGEVAGLGTVGLEESRGFVFVGEVPADVADVERVHEVDPGVGGSVVDGARTGSVTDAKLAHKDGEAGFVGGRKRVAKILLMSGSVEVQGVHDVVEVERAGGCFIYPLGPVGSTYEDHGVGSMLADDRDDLIGVVFDVVPGGVAIGLVADLVNDVGGVGVLLGNGREEGFGVVHVGEGIVI